jgi:hypothetical protein
VVLLSGQVAGVTLANGDLLAAPILMSAKRTASFADQAHDGSFQRLSSHVRIDASLRHKAIPGSAESMGGALSIAFRFHSRSTVAYRFVVVTLEWPSH